MKRASFARTLCVCLIAPVGYYWYLQNGKVGEEDSFPNWPPQTHTVQRELDAKAPLTPDGKNQQMREEIYTELFKNRYRKHQPQVAIGMKIMPGRRIKLMTPARMEPWDLDRLAMTAWRETHTVFGQNYDIDIYETYIGATPQLIGTLRALPGNAKIARISYDYSAHAQNFLGPLNRSARWLP